MARILRSESSKRGFVEVFAILGMLLALTMLGALPVAAEGAGPVLGADGVVLRLLTGPYGELIAGDEVAPDHPVLVLESASSEGTIERYLVPGTGSADVESSPTLVFDEGSHRTWLLWEQLVNGIHPLLQLISFDGTTFSEGIQLNAGIFTDKGSPQLLVTREDSGLAIDRTVLHVTWWQGSASGASRKLYAPIVLVNGERGESIPVFDLSVFVAAPVEPPEPISPADADLLTLRRGSHSLSTLVGFLEPETQRLALLELELVPRQLSAFAEKARLEIVIIGHRARSRQDLADEVRQRLVDLDESLHLSSRIYLAERVAMLIEDSPGGEVESEEGLLAMAEKARLEIVIIGSGIDTHGIDGSHESFFVDIDGDFEVGGAPQHLLEVSHLADFAAPGIPIEAVSSRFLLSESGTEALVAWELEERVFYRETRDGVWSETTFFEKSVELDSAAIYGMLQERISGR